MSTIRLTAGQALIRYLVNQNVEQRREVTPFFAGIWGIFGHGNIGGMAQAIQQYEDEFPYLPGPQRAGHGAHARSPTPR